jgi:molybdate transport system substrate-binding protein
MTRRKATIVISILAAFAVLAGWAARPQAEPKVETKELDVAAAASLREVFQSLVPTFEKQHKGVKVRLNFAGSQELRVQIENGAKVDVFASADQKHMAALEKQGLVKASALFAHNEPVVVVPANNPAQLAAFTDLPKAENVVLGVPEVPIGAYTELILNNAEQKHGKAFREKIVGHVRSRELNVRQVLTKVTLGEADVGIVYRTDAMTAKDRVKVIAIPDAINVVADYPIAVLANAPQPELAAAWVALVRGPEGQAALTAAGFKSPATSSK